MFLYDRCSLNGTLFTLSSFFLFFSLSWFFNLVEFSIRTSKMFNVDEESIAQYSNIELLQVSGYCKGNIDKQIFFPLLVTL